MPVHPSPSAPLTPMLLRGPWPRTRNRIVLSHAARHLPRYTSYPTAPYFGPEVEAATYRDWLAALPPDRPFSLYLHVPFCRSLCWYCGCHTTATQRSEPVERYLDMLEFELQHLAAALPARLPLIHVHWGGGSPTLVRAPRFLGIMNRLRRSFDLRADAEIAVEVDPRSLRDDFIAAMAEGGVTRVSLGVQTFDETVQGAINRVQPFAQVAGAVARLRDAGLGAINADLLYGLPGQTVGSCLSTTQRLLDLAPERVSVFGYAHVPHLKAHQRMIAEAELPGAAERLAQADGIGGLLEGRGYTAIGLDHFARADDELARAQRAGRLRRNFQGYTADPADTLLGVGASAIGCLPQGYVQNTASTAAWQRRVLAGEFATARGIAVSAEDRLRRAIIERIMCDLEADVAALAAAHGLPQPTADLAELEADGVVTWQRGRLRVREAFRPLARVVAAAFDARLASGATAAAGGAAHRLRHARAV